VGTGDSNFTTAARFNLPVGTCAEARSRRPAEPSARSAPKKKLYAHEAARSRGEPALSCRVVPTCATSGQLLTYFAAHRRRLAGQVRRRAARGLCCRSGGRVPARAPPARPPAAAGSAPGRRAARARARARARAAASARTPRPGARRDERVSAASLRRGLAYITLILSLTCIATARSMPLIGAWPHMLRLTPPATCRPAWPPHLLAARGAPPQARQARACMQVLQP